MNLGTMESVAIIVAGLISILIELVPPLKRLWDKKFNSSQKQVTIAAGVIVLVLLAAAYDCYFLNECPADNAKLVVDTIVAVVLGLVVAAGSHGSVKYIRSPKE